MTDRVSEVKTLAWDRNVYIIIIIIIIIIITVTTENVKTTDSTYVCRSVEQRAIWARVTSDPNTACQIPHASTISQLSECT